MQPIIPPEFIAAVAAWLASLTPEQRKKVSEKSSDTECRYVAVDSPLQFIELPLWDPMNERGIK